MRLDRSPNENGSRVNYRALALAQELRTRMTEGEIRSFPIVLWSVEPNFQTSFEKDETGHDLFDAQYLKGAINKRSSDIAREMIDLADGYKSIQTYRSRTVNNIYARLINLVDDYDIIDPRIAANIAHNRKVPAHIFANSIFRNLISVPGLLVGEELLAARLGVDIKKSPEWNKLLAKFLKNTAYTGVFGTAWRRWWMFKILKKWDELDLGTSLQGMEAEERVAVLRKKFRLKELVSAKPLHEGYSSKFWHVCELSKAPISSKNAVQLSADRREWQDAMYGSLEAILERKHIAEGYSLHVFELARIKTLIGSLDNGEG